MTESHFGKEIKAYTALAKLLADAEECKLLYEAAGLKIPEPLARILGHEDPAKGDARTAERFGVPPPKRPPAPEHPFPDEIYFPVEDAKETSLVLGLLTLEAKPVAPSLLVERLRAYRPDINKGTIANIGLRLDAAGTLLRGADGWSLPPGKAGPMIVGSYIWGSLPMFQVQEVASYRRLCIEHVLRTVPDGLQTVQIVRTLKESCPWLNQKIPINKDLLKMDIEHLVNAGTIKKIGNSGKWRVAD